jgi:hypothetical protein
VAPKCGNAAAGGELFASGLNFGSVILSRPNKYSKTVPDQSVLKSPHASSGFKGRRGCCSKPCIIGTRQGILSPGVLFLSLAF